MYNSERLIKAIGEIDEDKVERTCYALGYMRGGRKQTVPHVRAKKVLLFAAVLAMLLALGTGAYAVAFGGIRELWPKMSWDQPAFPTEAAGKIETREEMAQTEDWTCRILETYCDDTKLIITANVTCNDQFIPVATDAMEEEPAANQGFDYDGTLAEYAASQGKQLLLMNLGINDEAVGVITASVLFENVSDHELLILYSAEKSQVFEEIETSCIVTAHEFGAAEPERIELPLALQAGSAKELGVYVPLDPDAIPGIHAGEATLTRTPLGLNIQYPIQITDEEAYYDTMFFNGVEVDFKGQGAMGFTAEDGTEYARLTAGDSQVGGTLTIRYYDWDKQPIGDLVFQRK